MLLNRSLGLLFLLFVEGEIVVVDVGAFVRNLHWGLLNRGLSLGHVIHRQVHGLHSFRFKGGLCRGFGLLLRRCLLRRNFHRLADGNALLGQTQVKLQGLSGQFDLKRNRIPWPQNDFL